MVPVTGGSRTAPRSGSLPRPARAGPAVATGWVLVAGALGLQLLAPELVARVAPLVALVGIVLGVPHGAADHMVPFWTDRRRPRPREMAGVLAGYLAVAAAAAVALVLAPAPTVAAFLVVSAVHFGRAEVVVSAETAGRRPPGPLGDGVTAAAHGLAVVGLPFVLWPAESAQVLGLLAPWWGTSWSAGTRSLLAAVVLLAVLAALVSCLRRGRRTEAAELVAVAVLFALVPPMAAFGVWFAGWHALRHTARLLDLLGAGPGRTARAVGRLALHTAVPTLTTLAVVVVLAGTDASPVAVAAGLAVLLALTFPHVRTVALLDRWAAARR